MVKFYNSLMFRLTASFVILILTITGMTYLYTYMEARKALKSTIKDELMQLADMAVSQFTGETLQKYKALKPGEEDSKGYMDIVTMLYNFRKNNKDISEFYGLRFGDKANKKLVFTFDDWKIDRREELAKIDDPYDDYDEKILDAFDGKIASSDDFYTDDWGTFLSGYAPIKDEDGTILGVLGVDMRVNTVQAKIDFIGSLIYYVMGAAILVAGIMVLLFSMTIVKDIGKMTALANKISNGDLDFELPEITSKNEIYLLNEGMKSIVAAFNFLKEYAESKDKVNV